MLFDNIRCLEKKVDKKISILYNKWQFKEYQVSYGKNIGISGRVYISVEKLLNNNLKYGTISIGDNVIINSGWKYNLIGGDERTILRVIDDGKINIGNNVGISNACLVAFNEIRIEDNVLIGGGVRIYDSDFHSLNYDIRTSFPSYNGINSKPIVVKKGAFIGARSTILKGVIIGEKSIIGAGSIVTKDIPDYEIWAGNPCRFIRKL